MADDFKIVLGTGIDTSGAEKEIKSEISKIEGKYKINFDVDFAKSKADLIRQSKDMAQKTMAEIKGVTSREATKIGSAMVNEQVKAQKQVENAYERALKENYQRTKNNEQKKQQLKDQFNKKNLSSIDFEIKKREEEAARNSKLIKQQMIESVKAQKEIAAQTYASSRTDTKKLSMTSNVDAYLAKNTKMTKESIKQFNRLKSSIQDAGSVKDLNILSGQLTTLKNKVKEAGQEGMNLGDTFKNAVAKLGTWLSVSTVIMGSIRLIQTMKDNVIELDTAMTSLKKVTDETSESYDKFFSASVSNAKRLGTGISTLVTQTAEWAKAGYSLQQAAKLAETSTLFTNVGDVDSSTAVADMVTVMKAYNIEAQNSIQIVDALNEADNKFAVTTAGLGEGLKNSASAMAMAGNSFEETLALLTGGGEITQDVGELGNALKSTSLRMRGMKGELKDLGEEYEDVKEVSKLQVDILKETGGAVNIFKDDGSFKNTFQQIYEISKVFNDLTDVNRAKLLEDIAGKVFAGIHRNMYIECI